MKKGFIKKTLVFSLLGLSVLSVSTEAFSYTRPYWVRRIDPKVNTRVEERYDHNNNGWVGPRERYTENHRFVNRPREYACDHNHNGLIGPHEAGCAYW